MKTPVEGHEGKTTIGLAPLPRWTRQTQPLLDSLVQVAFTGDETLIDYTQGVTMRNREGTLFKVEEQAADEGVRHPPFGRARERLSPSPLLFRDGRLYRLGGVLQPHREGADAREPAELFAKRHPRPSGREGDAAGSGSTA